MNVSESTQARLSQSGEAPRVERFPVAYLAHYFPSLHQTFVYREIQSIEKLGWKVHPFSIRRPTKAISAEAEELATRTFYLLPPSWPRFVGRQLALLLAHPLRYVGLLLWIVSRPGESLRARIHALTHFFGGIYLVPELRRQGIRHIHAHFGRNPATLALVASEYSGIPFSVTIHARDLFVDAALLPAKIARAKFIATISEYNRRLLEKMASDDKAARKIHVVHCGIDPEKFAPATKVAGEEHSDEPPLFVAVGRLVQKKGYRYLIEAARILKERGVSFRIRVIGGGPDEELLQGRIEKLDVADRIRLEGSMPQEQVLPILKEADAFVLPCVLAEDGDQDGIPVSLMEALACGVPCVSSSLSGIPELIESEKNGFLVPEKDPEALAGALQRLAEDPQLRRRLGRGGREKVLEAFTLEVEAREMDRLFRATGQKP